MQSRSLLFMAVAAISLATACSSVRQTRPLAYGGEDSGSTIAPLQAVLKKRGYTPVCSAEEFCKFQQNPDVTIHFKVKGDDKVVLAIDVSKKVPENKRQALTDSAMKLGEEIFAEASITATANEKAQAEARRAEAEREAREAQNKPAAKEDKGGGFLGALSAATDVLGAVNASTSVTTTGGSSGGAGKPSAGGTSGGAQGGSGGGQTTCCINKAFYDCPSSAAVYKCSGEFMACVSKCGFGGDFKCTDACMKDHPPDPSQCTRDSSRDATCT
ncbi:hypothetical protein [Chondromyces apiculatus]|nr:hypothetical protein [Chondromyces apiculatus]